MRTSRVSTITLVLGMTSLALSLAATLSARAGGRRDRCPYHVISVDRLEPVRGTDQGHPQLKDPNTGAPIWIDCGSLNAGPGDIGGRECGEDPQNLGDPCFDCTAGAVSEKLGNQIVVGGYQLMIDSMCGTQTAGTCGMYDCENTVEVVDEDGNSIDCPTLRPNYEQQTVEE